MQAAPLAHKRYRLGEPLGKGAAGIVYRAHDLELDRRVALKILHLLGAEDIFRLKKEFRALAGLSHPNLVELYDLVADGPQWFFTMELIEGQSFVESFRGDCDRPRAVDFDRLREAIRQLVLALGALHAQHKLHRDIKPTNVLVEGSGRVVLVDFGLVTNQLSRSSQDSGNGVLAGTLAYMAPEQMWGKPSPASDWYGVGAMLYETLTGVAPRDGDGLRAIFEGRGRMPRPPRELAPDTPADLDDLVMALLRTGPEERPDAAQTLGRLATSRRIAPVEIARLSAAPPAPFVGRAEELQQLDETFTASARCAPRIVTIEGPSGIGKTVLVEHFLRRVEVSAGNVVLRARCHPRESVPFKAVDGLVDDLARFLCLQPKESIAALLPEGSAILPVLFPVFGRVCPRVAAPVGEPHEVRRAAFGVLRELVERVAASYPTIVWIDDLQWGDLDSAALIRELLREPDPPKLMFVVSFRDDVVEGHEVLRELTATVTAADAATVLRLDLRPLSVTDSRRLAETLLDGKGDAAAVAEESGGNPLIVGELARHHAVARAAVAPVRFTDVITTRIERLSARSRRLLNLVSVAGEPMTERLLYRLAGSTPDVRDAISELRRLCLLRTAVRGGEAALEAYHHRIGETVSALLGTDSCRALHRDIAAALERLPDANPQQLVEHYLRAGDLARAGEHAYASAEKAVAAMAFHGAARLYRQAIELGTSACPSWQLNVKLGDALIAAGRSGEGAACLAAAAHALAAHPTENLEALRLERRAAEYYLRGGLHAEGVAALRGVLSALRLPYLRTPTNALLSLIGNRMQVAVRRKLQRDRPARDLSSLERERLEACWSAGIGLSLLDQMRAAAFQARHALLAHRAGDRAHLARALATEGFIVAWEGGVRKRRRARELRHQGERLARRTNDPNIRVHSVLMSAVCAYYELRLREALELCAEGERLCREECVGAIWELANLQVLTGNTLACLGDLPRLRTHLPDTLRQARERDDRYCQVIAPLGYNNTFWLASDRPDDARRHAEEALAGPFPGTFAWQLYQGALALTRIELYRGDGGAGWDRMPATWATLRQQMILRFQTPRIEMRYLWARCALQKARTAGGSERGRLLRFAARAARRIDAEDAPWVAPFVDSLRAGVFALRGQAEQAVQRLEGAALGFEELGMVLHASAARHQAGLPSRAHEETWMRARGVTNPERMADMLAPSV